MNNEWIKGPSAYNDTFMISFFSAFDYQLLGHLKRFDNQYPAKLLLTENETWLVAAKLHIIILSLWAATKKRGRTHYPSSLLEFVRISVQN